MLNPNQIRARLLERNIMVVDVARRFKVSPTTISVIINGWGKSRRIMEWIAKTIELPFKEVWANHNKKAA